MSSKLKLKSSSKSQGKLVSKSKDGMPAKGQESTQARPSHEQWPPLPTAPATPGTKCSAVLQLPTKKVEAKVARRLSMQQIAGQPQLSWLYLPSTPTSVKHYKTLKRSMASLGQERDHLSREARATEEHYTATSELGQTLPVLMQPAQASGITTQAVPRIQAQELCLKNAGARLRDQALAQNLINFSQREKECEQKEQSRSADVATLAHTIGRIAQPAPIRRRGVQDRPAKTPTRLNHPTSGFLHYFELNSSVLP